MENKYIVSENGTKIPVSEEIEKNEETIDSDIEENAETISGEEAVNDVAAEEIINESEVDGEEKNEENSVEEPAVPESEIEPEKADLTNDVKLIDEVTENDVKTEINAELENAETVVNEPEKKDRGIKVEESQDNDSTNFEDEVKKKINEKAEALKSLNIGQENYESIFDILNKIDELTQKGQQKEKPVKANEAGEEGQEKEEKHSEKSLYETVDNSLSADQMKANAFEEELVEEVSLEEEPHEEGKSYEFEKEEEVSEEEWAKTQDDETRKEPSKKLVYGKTVLPPFVAVTDDGKLETINNCVVKGYDSNDGTYSLSNGEKDFSIPAKTLNTILMNEEEVQEKKRDFVEITSSRTIVFAAPEKGEKGTVLPEFSLISDSGIKTYKDFVVKSHDTEDGSYTLTNGNDIISVDRDKFEEIIANKRFEQKFDENTPAYKKLLQSQYNDFFQERENKAINFRHNLAVYCRKEANNPLDAVKIAKEIINRMPEEEKEKTKKLMKEIGKRQNMSVAELITSEYHNAIGKEPLNVDKILENKRRVTRAFDAVSDKGATIEKDPSLVKNGKDYNLKIGDSISELNFSVENVFGKGKEKMSFSDVKIISASKEDNSITVMQGKDSVFVVPRDKLLEAYREKAVKEIKQDVKKQRNNSISIDR